MSVTWKCPSPIGRNANPCTRFRPLAFKKSGPPIINLKSGFFRRKAMSDDFFKLNLLSLILVDFMFHFQWSRSQHCSARREMR